jgi:hypothetical protein
VESLLVSHQVSLLESLLERLLESLLGNHQWSRLLLRPPEGDSWLSVRESL